MKVHFSAQIDLNNFSLSRHLAVSLPLALVFTLLLTSLILSASTVVGAPHTSPFPIDDNPQFTQGELLIRVTPQAQAGLERFHNESPLQKLHDQMGVRSVYPLFPHVAHPESNPNLERIYLLRFQIPTDLYTVRAYYAAHPLIEEAEFNYVRQTQASEITPNDPLFEEQWNLALIDMPGAWGIEKGDPEVIIAVVDTGFDYTTKISLRKRGQTLMRSPTTELMTTIMDTSTMYAAGIFQSQEVVMETGVPGLETTIRLMNPVTERMSLE